MNDRQERTNTTERIKELEDGVVLAIEQRDAAEAKLAMVKAAIERFRTSGDGGPTAWETVSAIEEILS